MQQKVQKHMILGMPRIGSYEGEAVHGVKCCRPQAFWQLGVTADFWKMDELIFSCVAGTFLKGNQPTLIPKALGWQTSSQI